MTADRLHIRRIRKALLQVRRVREMVMADMRQLKQAEADLKAAIASATKPDDPTDGERAAA